MTLEEWQVQAASTVISLMDNPSLMLEPQVLYVMIRALEKGMPYELHTRAVELVAHETELAQQYFQRMTEQLFTDDEG